MTMKWYLKLANTLFFVTVIVILLPMSAALAEGAEERGRLNVKLDRISGSKEDQAKRKTELENVFPELFKEETKELIHSTQVKQEEALEDLYQSIFEMESQADATTALVQKSLFTESYAAPTADRRVDEEPGEGTDHVLLVSAVGFIVMIGGIVFTMMRQVME
ncbi:type VII secretion protein EssA [Bacillus lacus]|uniref:Type VII secretion protein EssA n=1 Tax=Metabacillus lacus TaxID=1983721 RepID=A0A7X2J061_9BACI|nr:type VII secretion protein EssA [Metabacillus lacus]MRX72687.1 type VII secretion protein EssA [Metabacillus lacus]